MRKIKREDEGVSPVIATILMVAITVVLAATLYMMLPSGSNQEATEAMSGSIDETSDGWIVEVIKGSVAWDSNKPQFYNKSSGAVYSDSAGNDPFDGKALSVDNDGDEDDITITFNDNNDNGDIDGGDSFKITWDPDDTATLPKEYFSDHYQFRVEGTNLQQDFM